MATGLLERTKQNDVSLKAYGKLSGGVQPADFTEEQRAFDFNSKIPENYQKLINPDYQSAEDFGDGMRAEEQAPVYNSQEEYAMATLYPERAQEQPVQQAAAQPVQAQAPQAAPSFEHHRVTADLFRADSSINARTAYAEPAAPAFEAQAPAYTEVPAGGVQQAPAYEPYEEENADLTPTAMTIQYRSDLYREEQQADVEEKRGALTAKGKLLMAIYAIVVVVVLALIIVNTSVLKTLDGEMAAREAQLSEAMARYESLQNDIEIAKSEDTIRSWGESHGMYLPD